MHLFDPLRPKSPDARPNWLRDHIPIPKFEISPLESGDFELSIWLPIPEKRFASMRFTKILNLLSFQELIKNFVLDPELTCENLFQNEYKTMQPELRHHTRQIYQDEETNPIIEKKKQKRTASLDLENITFD